MKVLGSLTFVLTESRGARGRLLFFTLCISIGVAAVVGVAGASAALAEGIRSQSKELLAADFAVRGRQPLPDGLDDFFTSGFERTDIRELATMAAVGDGEGNVAATRLVELKVVAGDYPFYGVLELEPPAALDELVDAESVVIAPELAAALDVGIGGELRIGGAGFTVAGIVHDEPDRLELSFTLGPRVFLSADGLERTALLGVGNRVRYKALYRVPGDPTHEELSVLRDRIRDELPEANFLRMQTHADSQAGLRRGLQRFTSFLGLVALLSLVLGGIGVAQIVRTWLASRAIGIAVLRTVGLRPHEILILYLSHVVLLALIGSLAGAVLGSLVPYLGPLLAPELLPPELIRAWQPLAAMRGIVLGIGLALLFSLPALTAVWRVSPALVLRSEAQPLSAPRTIRYGALLLLVGGLFVSALVQGRDLERALGFTGGLLGVGALLWLGARGVMRVTALVPRRLWNATFLHGVSALGRPGAGTVGAVVALGLGVLVVAAMVLIETRLEDELAGALPAEAPSAFLVDIQPDQWAGVRGLMEEVDGEAIESVPVVMARLRSIDDQPVTELIAEQRDGGRGRARWVLTREQRLTWQAELPEHSRLEEGELWSDPERPELSIEEGYAEDLGVGVGSRLVFDVQGVPVETWVTSLRSVEWESFAINFFLVAEPGVLDDAPQFRLATVRLEDEARENELQNRLATEYPNVTLLRLRSILEKVADLLKRLTLGVRLIGGFTIVVGLVILAGSVAATQVRRGHEVALWKTLGVTRRGIVLLFAAEFALCGLVAGALGGLGAFGLSWAFLEEVLDLPAELPLASLPVTALGSAVLATLAGIAASVRALAVRPLESLRHE